jgi:hypothetical protein
MTALVILIADTEFPMATEKQITQSIMDFMDIGAPNITEFYYSADEICYPSLNDVAVSMHARHGLPSVKFHADWADDKKAAAYKRDRHMFRVARRNYKPEDIVVVAITGHENLQSSERPAKMIEEAGRKGFKTHHVSITDHWRLEF